MSENNRKEKEILVNFKITSEKYEKIFFIARELYGHGGIKKVYNILSNDFLQKYDGKSAKLDTFLDPNFKPKPNVYDSIEKNVMPYAANLSDSELHEFRVWAYQVYNICMAYSKMAPNKRKNNKMTYDQLFDFVYKGS